MTQQNAAGNDVHLHITNYQKQYFGGAAMIRLYHFDLERNTIDVETFSPWMLEKEPARRTVLAARKPGSPTTPTTSPWRSTSSSASPASLRTPSPGPTGREIVDPGHAGVLAVRRGANGTVTGDRPTCRATATT